MRNTRKMPMILWTGGREGFLIVHFLRDALDCIWCAVNRITVDQHDGQLHPFDQLHLHHQHHVTFATNTFWATSWSWLGILLLTCQRGMSRNYLRRICHISGCQSEMLTHLYLLTTELFCWSQIPSHTGLYTMDGALGLWNFLGDTRLLLTSGVSCFTAPAVWESFL